MNRLIISAPILIALFALLLLENILDSSMVRPIAVADNGRNTDIKSSQFLGSVAQTYALTTTLFPDASATMVYTSTAGTIINLYFPPQTTDITRTIALITQTEVPRPGFVGGEFAFSLTSIGGGVDDGYFVHFFAPVSLTISYDDSFIPTDMTEAESQMYFVQWKDWSSIENTCSPPQSFHYDEDNNVISGLICRPALYAYLGTNWQYLPIVARQ